MIERFHNATVLLVIDRTELEGQLKGWVERLLGEMKALDIATERADSKAKLQSLLDAGFRGLIVAMIHKFEAIRKNSCMRDNVFVFIAIAESIERDDDPKHMLALSTMTVPAEQLDKEFFELAGSEGVTDVEELNKVLDRAVGLRTFLTADDRIENVAAFAAEHFKESVLPLGKAFLVAVNREACAKYKQALDKLLPPEWTEAVYTENAADTIDRPLVAQLQLSEEREKNVRELFRKPTENPKILIVTPGRCSRESPLRRWRGSAQASWACG